VEQHVSKNKDMLSKNQDNVSEWSNMWVRTKTYCLRIRIMCLSGAILRQHVFVLTHMLLHSDTLSRFLDNMSLFLLTCCSTQTHYPVWVEQHVSKNKDMLSKNQDNVSEWSNMWVRTKTCCLRIRIMCLSGATCTQTHYPDS
jgi:hypothetical protein